MENKVNDFVDNSNVFEIITIKYIEKDNILLFIYHNIDNTFDVTISRIDANNVSTTITEYKKLIEKNDIIKAVELSIVRM